MEDKKTKLLKDQMKKEALEHPLKKDLMPGENSFIDFILLGFYQQKSDPQVINTVKSSLMDFLTKKPEFNPIFTAAALWITFGVTEPFAKKKKELARKKLHIYEGEKKTIYETLDLSGQYRSKHGVFLRKINDKNLRIFVHELTHSLDRLLYGDVFPYPRNKPELEKIWKENAAEFIRNLTTNITNTQQALLFNKVQTLNYQHYPKDEWVYELKTHYFEYQFLYPDSPLPFKDDSIDQFLSYATEKFFMDVELWTDSYIEEAGLHLLEGFKANFLLGQSIDLTQQDIELINEAREKGLLIIDVYIQRAIKSGTNLKSITEELYNREISPYVIIQAAVRINNLDLLKEVHSSHILNLKSKSLVKALHYAARSGNIDVFNYLISEMHINLFAQDNLGRDIFHWRNDCNDEIKAIIDKQKEKHNIFHAIATKQIDSVVSLLNTIDINEIHSTHGSVLLHAILKSDSAIINTILEQNDLDINVEDKIHNNALFLLLHNQNLSFSEIKILFAKFIDRGINLGGSDINGESLAHKIIKAKQFTVQEKIELLELTYINGALLNKGDNNTCLPLHSAIKKDSNLDLVKYLVEKNPESVNHKENNDYTPVHYAILGNAVNNLNFLLNAKKESSSDKTPEFLIDVNMKTQQGVTLLHFAIIQGNEEMIKAILARPDLDLTITDDHQKTAFDYLQNEEDKVKYLNIWKYSGGQKSHNVSFFNKPTREQTKEEGQIQPNEAPKKKFGI